jgi:hydroxyquinol 1,2-dioxygenase
VIDIDERTITRAVLEAQEKCGNPRLKQVMESLVRHLHDFAREVALTEKEWLLAIEFLTEAGHITDDKRQEFILLSDTLGLSTLVTAQNNAKPAGCTESTVFGPFFVEGAPKYVNGDDISNGAKGQPCYVSGRVRSIGGEAIAGAQISVWQSDEDGFYDVQRPELEGAQARGELVSGPDGRYYFKTILAAPYPIPHDGPVGRMLQQLGRHPWRPAHLHFMVKAPGFQNLITHIFRAGDPYLESDAVFGVRSSLVTHWIRHEPGVAPDGSQLASPFYTVEYDIVLNPLQDIRR